MSLLKNNPGRLCGFLYLLLLVGPLRLIYIPTVLFVHGDATKTAANITVHETLFRLGMASEVFGAMVRVFLVLAFYRLFRGVDRNLALQVIILGGVLPACGMLFNVGLDGAVLLLAKGADFLSAFDKSQRDALALLFLRLWGQETTAAETLWGLWLLPLGLLVIRSGFLPRFIGYWLLVNGVAYVALSMTGLMWPDYEDTVSNITFPAMLGELVLMGWLATKGVSQDAVDARARMAASIA